MPVHHRQAVGNTHFKSAAGGNTWRMLHVKAQKKERTYDWEMEEEYPCYIVKLCSAVMQKAEFAYGNPGHLAAEILKNSVKGAAFRLAVYSEI